MGTSQEDENRQALREIKELSDILVGPSRFYTIIGVFFLIAGALVALMDQTAQWPAAAVCAGTVPLVLGLSLGLVAARFRKLDRWAFPVMYVLLATFWGFGPLSVRGGDKGGGIWENRRKMRSRELRSAFGLAPLQTNQDDDNGK